MADLGRRLVVVGRPRRGRRNQGDKADGEESGSAAAGVAEERERRWGCCCGCIPDQDELRVAVAKLIGAAMVES